MIWDDECIVLEGACLVHVQERIYYTDQRIRSDRIGDTLHEYINASRAPFMISVSNGENLDVASCSFQQSTESLSEDSLAVYGRYAAHSLALQKFCIPCVDS